MPPLFRFLRFFIFLDRFCFPDCIAMCAPLVRLIDESVFAARVCSLRLRLRVPDDAPDFIVLKRNLLQDARDGSRVLNVRGNGREIGWPEGYRYGMDLK